jgi:hypothetical protein
MLLVVPPPKTVANPLISHVFVASRYPSGNADPDFRTHVYGGVPRAAVMRMEYGCPEIAAGSDVTVA